MSRLFLSSNRLRKAPPIAPTGLNPGLAGQGLVEFALVLPLLLLLLFGIIETGRLMVIYSSISSGAKQATRYGSVAGSTGQTVGGAPLLAYQDCRGIRNHVRQAMPLMYLTDNEIQISYSPGYITQTVGICAPNAITPTKFPVAGSLVITDGYQIIITVTATYSPIVPLVPIPPLPIRFVSARTIFTSIQGPTLTPKPDPDLSIAKAVNFTSAPQNTQLVYTITVNNPGPGSASSPIMNDTWSPGKLSGVAFSAIPSGWNCTVGTNSASCTKFTSMVSNTVATFVMRGTIAVNSGTVTNTARISYARTDPDTSNNSATVSTLVVSGPDFVMNKTASAASVQTGQRITYTLSVRNQGQNTGGSASFKVTDTVPVSQVININLPAYCAITPGNMTTKALIVCSFSANLTSGGTQSLGSFAIDTPNFATTLVNTATVGVVSGATDANLTNNTASVTTTVSDEVDLYIGDAGMPIPNIANAGPDPVNPPRTVTYNLTVGNGPGTTGRPASTARNVQVTFDKQQSAFPYVTANGTNWVCGAPSGNLVTCNYTSVITASTTAQELTVVVSATTGSNLTSFLASATVASTTQAEINNADNTATRTINIDNCDPNQPTLVPVSASATNVAADGTAYADIFVQLRSACSGNPLVTASSYISITSSRGGDSIQFAPGYANPTTSGIIGFRVRSSTIGASTYSASGSTGSYNFVGSNTVTVNFNACNRVSPSASSVTASPSEVFANGTNYATVVVSLRDDCGNAVSASTLVTLTSSRGVSDTIVLAPGSTNPSTTGSVSFRVSSNSAGTSTYSASANTLGTVANIADTENVLFYKCVDWSLLPLGAKNIQFNLTNPGTWTWRLTNLSLTWVTGTGQKMTTIGLGPTGIIWIDSNGTTVNPLVLGPTDWNTSDRSILAGTSETLDIGFKQTLNTGNYTAFLTFDDPANASHSCTVTLAATK